MAQALHAEQLSRYRQAARAAGASSVRTTLVPLDAPEMVVESVAR
jgi:hypothetical protein